MTTLRHRLYSSRSGLIIGWLVAIAIVFLTLRWIGLSGVLKALKDTSIPLLLLALATYLSTILIRLLKWHSVLSAEHGFAETFVVYSSSKAAGSMLPARTGELAPLVSKRFRTRRVSALIIVDRAFETSATLLLGAIGFVLLNFYDATLMILWISVFVALWAVLLLLIYTGFWRRLRKLSDNWARLSRTFEVVEKVSDGLHALKGSFPLLMGLTFLATAVDFVYAQMLFLSIGASVSFWLVAAVWCASGVVSVIAFTPSGLGIADLSGVYLYSKYGTPLEQVGAAFVLTRTIGALFPWLVFLLALSLLHKHDKGLTRPSEGGSEAMAVGIDER